MSSVIKVTAIDYPESDGKPMAETDDHRDEMIRHLQLLDSYFAGQHVYVSGNLLIFYEQGDPKKFVAPDVFVAKGIASKKRRHYKIWVEGKAPDVAIETTSRKTKRNDLVTKPELYARLGVKEYFLFDPIQEYLDPPLQGYRLEGQQYVSLQPDAGGSLWSKELGLRLVVEHGALEFYTPAGERLLTHAEARQAAEKARTAAEKKRRAEVKARQAAEKAQQAAEKAQQAAEKARQDAEAHAAREAEARKAAEAECERLRLVLQRRGDKI
jgi:Uma2 family endonuclease